MAYRKPVPSVLKFVYMPAEHGETRLSAGPVFSEFSRVLALDWGAKRVGMAISDPLGITAQGLSTMSRKNRERDLNHLKSVARKHNVTLILLGMPLQMDGTEGPHAEMIRSLAGELENRLGVEVRLWDERLTSVEAHRMFQEAGVSASKRRQSVDRIAAVLLLQNFLDSQPRRQASLEAAP